MSWQDILKINVDERELRQLVSPEDFDRLTQGETSDENLPQKILNDLRFFVFGFALRKNKIVGVFLGLYLLVKLFNSCLHPTSLLFIVPWNRDTETF